MGDKSDERGKSKPKSGEDRRGRLAEALRANLLKRKARARARKTAEAPKEGRQGRA